MPCMMRQRPLITGLCCFMEVWKKVEGFENYEVSSLGNVKSLPRKKCNYRGCYITKEKILKQHLNKNYMKVRVLDKILTVHQLVSMAFLNHRPDGSNKLVVDHINNDKLDNRLENLQIITNRVNCSKDLKKKSSKYIGVSWDNNRNKWQVGIKINGKRISLGRFKCELEASNAYQNKLKEIC